MTSSWIGSRRSLKAAIALLAICAFFVPVRPVQAAAIASVAAGDLTQAQYLELLATASAGKSALPARPSLAAYMKWAADRGIQPDGGWKPDAQLTRDVYAQTLAQLYGVRVTTDPARALKDVGVIVPSAATVTRAAVLRELNDFGFESQTALAARHPATPIDHDPKVVVCHNGHDEQISRSAFSNRQQHGDYLGSCSKGGHGRD
jgi:hypothetical protein